MDTPASTPAVKKKLHQSPLVQIIAILIAQAGTLLASNYRVKTEAQSKAAEVHLQAEAGYAVTKELAKKFDEDKAEKSERIAKLEGQVQILAQQFDRHRTEWKPVRRQNTPEPVEPSAYEALRVVQKAAPAPMKATKIPTDLEDAVQWGQRKQ